MATAQERFVAEVIGKCREHDIEVTVINSGDDFRIERPEDTETIEALKEKIEEYAVRMGDPTRDHTDSVHKFTVFSYLVNTGDIEGRTLVSFLEKELSEGFRMREAVRACVVLIGYVTDGGTKIWGGTGFGKNHVAKDAS